jgi:purine-binding chemotaxis protein CheW
MQELGQRAQEKARAGGALLQLVSFKVGNEEFGLDILKVQEIIRLRELTRVPNMPDFVDGVINLRGKVIPVIGLRRRMGIPAGEDDKRTRIVVAEVNGKVLGFVVDEVSEVLRIPEANFEPPPKLGQVEREYVQGIGKIDERLLILIDLSPLLSDREHSQIAAVEQEPVEAV